MNKMINFDKLIGGHDDIYRNLNPNTIQHPSRTIIFGPSGSGKTNVLLNLLFNIALKMTYDRIYLYTKDVSEKKYKYLIRNCQAIENVISNMMGQPRKILYVSTDLNNIIPLDQISKDKQSIVIFDDMISEKNQDVIVDYWIRSRKRNCSCFYLAQSFYRIPIEIRENTCYFMLFQVNSYKTLKRIFDDVVKGVEWATFKKIYHITLRNNIHGFVTIDNVSLDYKRRIRIGI